jgi:hypothetical protein
MVEAPLMFKLDAERAELAEIEAESIGWQPLEPGVYLHISDDQATEVLVTGIAQAGAAVLLVG